MGQKKRRQVFFEPKKNLPDGALRHALYEPPKSLSNLFFPKNFFGKPL